MELVKKNIVLFIVLLIALFVSLFLFYKVIQKKRELDESRNNLEKLKSDVKLLTDEKPAPTDANFQLIEADTRALNQKLHDLLLVFGTSYRTPLTEFAKIVLHEKDGEKAYHDLRDRFKTFWNREAKRDTSPHMLLDKFLGDLEIEVEATPIAEATEGAEAEASAETKTEVPPKKEKVKLPEETKKAAFAVFQKGLEKETDELINATTIRDLLLEAFGLPREINPETCKSFMTNLRERLMKRISDGKILATEEVQKFTFSEYVTGGRMPPVSEIPKIVRHWKMIEDLFRRRIIPAKGNELSIMSFTRNNLDGYLEKDYLYLRYSIELHGDIDSIRNFIANLQKAAHEDRRIYSVREIKIEKIVDEVKTLTEKGGTAEAIIDRKPIVDYRELKKIQDQTEYEDKIREIGMPIIGIGNMVKAVIEFDSVHYLGNELRIK